MSNILPTRNLNFDLDRTDDLPPEGAFILPGGVGSKTYLCGHSLGPVSTDAKPLLLQELDRWGRLGIDGYFEGESAWLEYLDPMHEMMCKIVGASKFEVVIMNSLTVNIHLLLAGFYSAKDKRNKILMERSAFVSDIYAVQSHVQVRGEEDPILWWDANVETGHYELSDFEELLRIHGDEISIIFLGGVNFLTGQVLEIKMLTALAHARGIVIGFDLAHAAGNIELQLHDWDVDFGVWCTYKYLCGGPGSVGACFIHENHASLQLHFEGWWGNSHENRFDMLPHFTPATLALGWQLSNPPLLALPSLKASLAAFDRVGMAKIASKSHSLAAYLMELLEGWEGGTILTPKAKGRHGAMVSLRCGSESERVFDALTTEGFVVDHRKPHTIRVTGHGLYNTYDDCYRFANALKKATE